MTRVPVRTERADYIAALAELSAGAVRVDDRAGAVVVIEGTGSWCAVARAAAASGAVGLIVAEPERADVSDLEELLAASDGIPVIICRSRLRADVAHDAIRARGDAVVPNVVLADVTCVAAESAELVRDALGWIRVLAGADLRLVSAATGKAGVLAHLEGEGPLDRVIPAALSLCIAAVGWSRPVLRVSGLGAVRTEVVIDSAAVIASVDTFSEGGASRASERYEETARVALRRCLAVVAGGRAVTDLADLLGDTRLSEALLRYR